MSSKNPDKRVCSDEAAACEPIHTVTTGGIPLFKRMTAGEIVFQIFAITMVTFICIIIIYPFLHVFSLSFSTPRDALRLGLHILPREWSLESYKQVFEMSGLYIGMGNTLYRTIVGTL